MEIVLDVAGVPVHINGWMLFWIVYMWLFAYPYLVKHSPDSTRRKRHFFAILAAVAIVFSIVIHEAAHAIVSLSFGYGIVDASFSAFGAYVRAGVLISEMQPLQEFAFVIAGPLANFILAILFAIPVWLMGESLQENTFQCIAVINYRLAWMNMIPVVFLDGGKVVQSLIWWVTGNYDLSISLMIPISILSLIVLIRYINRPTIISNIEKKLEVL